MGKTFWELLPDDVLANIAKFFKDSIDDYENALVFAKCSETHRRAAMEALDHRLLFRLYDNYNVVPVLRCFGDLVQEVSVSSIQGKILSTDLPRFSSLRKARILAEESHLALIEGLPSLTTLAVSVIDCDIWKTLVTTIRSLPCLKEIVLDFRPFLRLVPSSAEQLQFAEACPKVERLELEATFLREFWKLIKNLRSLRRLSLRGFSRTGENVSFLRKLDEVELCGAENSISQATDIGEPITKLVVSRPQPAGDFANLRSCCKLRDLYICLQAGAEKNLLGNICNVEALDLRWKVAAKREGSVYYKPDTKFFLDLVRRHPKVRKLGIFFAVVPIDVIERVIETMGDRLESLLIPVEHQPESTAVRMEKTLNAVSKWCPNITNLFFHGHKLALPTTPDQKRKCLIALANSMRNCPKLTSAKELRDYMESFISFPVKRKRSGNLSGSSCGWGLTGS